MTRVLKMRMLRNMATQTSELVSSSEACRILGISRSTLTYWILTNRVAVAQTLEADSGRATQHLFRRVDVEALATQRIPAGSSTTPPPG